MSCCRELAVGFPLNWVATLPVQLQIVINMSAVQCCRVLASGRPAPRAFACCSWRVRDELRGAETSQVYGCHQWYGCVVSSLKCNLMPGLTHLCCLRRAWILGLLEARYVRSNDAWTCCRVPVNVECKAYSCVGCWDAACHTLSTTCFGIPMLQDLWVGGFAHVNVDID